MRYSDLLEAPIADIGQMDYGDAALSFDKADRHLLSSDRAHSRFFKAFEKTPFIFKVTFVHHGRFAAADDATSNNVDSHLRRQNVGLHTDLYKFPAYPLEGEKQLVFKAEEGVITVVMLGNLSPVLASASTRMPITPWTLAHKIGHSFYESYGTYKTKNYTRLTQALEQLRDFENYSWNREMMTMRSARKGLLDNNDFDDVAELIAQYLITGRVTLNVSDKGQDRVDHINQIVHDLISEAVGKIIVEM